MAEPTPIKKLFTRPRFGRLRKLGLLPPPIRRQVKGGSAWMYCYEDAGEVLKRLDRLIQLGLDRLSGAGGRGRHSLEDIARAAGVYRG